MTKLILILLTLSNAVLIADCIITHAELKAVKNGMCVLPKGYVAKPIVERLEFKKLEASSPQNIKVNAEYIVDKININTIGMTKQQYAALQKMKELRK